MLRLVDRQPIQLKISTTTTRQTKILYIYFCNSYGQQIQEKIKTFHKIVTEDDIVILAMYLSNLNTKL